MYLYLPLSTSFVGISWFSDPRGKMEVVESSEEVVRLVQPETRWVDGSEIDSQSSKWSGEDAIMRENELGGVRRRLSKKPKRVDSFDVEAMGITSYNAYHKKVCESPLCLLFDLFVIEDGTADASTVDVLPVCLI